MRFDNIDKELGKISSNNPFYDVIQRAYKAFKQSPTNDHGVCDCCMYPEVQKDFFNHSQAGLPMIYLNDWFLQRQTHLLTSLLGASSYQEFWKH